MLQPGDRIGRYEIQRRLGRGGMGTVYVAHDPVLGRMVAIKLFAGDLDAADAAEKFAREARAAAALNHSNIVTIHDFGEFDSQPFIVMEYVQGETVARLIRKKAELTLSDRLRLIEELCDGVSYAHGFEVIHRDIKPANLMVDRSNHLKVLDFGIARILGTSLSKGTALIGTPGYMAPEQIRGGTIDRRSDLFSIGVVSYELLSYSEAFPGDSVAAITHRILTEEPVPLAQLVPDIPSELAAIVERALKKDAAERFPDARTLRAAIAQVHREVDGDSRYDTLRISGGSRGPVRPSGPGRDPDSRSTPLTPGATTPASDAPSRRADVGRRRTEKIETALARARAQLAQGDLQDAHDSCVEALMLDEGHAGALQLEKEIIAAIVRQRIAELAAAGREAIARGALPEVEELLRQIRELDPGAIEARPIERDLRLKRVEQADAEALAESVRQTLERGRAALERGDLDAALTAARHARRLDPASADAQPLEAEARRRMDLEAGVEDSVPGPEARTVLGPATLASSGEVLAPTVIAPGVRSAPPSPTKNPAPTDGRPKPPISSAPPAPPMWEAVERVWATVRAKCSQAAKAVTAFATVDVPHFAIRLGDSASGLAARISERLPRRATGPAAKLASGPGLGWFGANRVLIAWTAGGALVIGLAAASAFVLLKPAPSAPAALYGTVTIDAIPWATLMAVLAQDGTRYALPEPASTPLSMQLPVGIYRLTLAGPSPGAPPQEVTVTIENGKNVMVENVRFQTLTAEAYFEPYLLVPDPVSPETGGAAPAQTGSAPSQQGSR